MVQLGSLWGILEHVVGISVGYEPFSGDGYGYLGHVDGNPPAAPGLGLEGHGSGAAGEVQHEVPWVGCHQEAAFEDLWGRFYDILLVLAAERYQFHMAFNVPSRNFLFIFLPPDSVPPWE